jgi:hypothetical protein
VNSHVPTKARIGQGSVNDARFVEPVYVVPMASKALRVARISSLAVNVRGRGFLPKRALGGHDARVRAGKFHLL